MEIQVADEAVPIAEIDETKKADIKRSLWVIGLQVTVLLVLFQLAIAYAVYHDVPGPITIFYIYSGAVEPGSFSSQLANYNFLGVTNPDQRPSFYVVLMEVLTWSFAGVLARTEFQLTQIIVRRKKFGLLEQVSKIIGDSSMGVAISIAVVAFLLSTEVMSISLKDANIETIAAISFILGFYHEDTRHLLGNFRKRISGATEQSEADQAEAEPSEAEERSNNKRIR